MSCININSQEYKDILAELGDPIDAHIEFIRRYGLEDDAVEIKEGVTEPILDRPFFAAFQVYEKLLNEAGEKPKSFEYNRGKYILNTDGTYDLTDPDTGSIFMHNIDIETGQILQDPATKVEVTAALKQSLMLDMIQSNKDGLIETLLATKGYSYQEIFNNLANAKNMAEYNKIVTILNKLC
jgi:hypothetical protein